MSEEDYYHPLQKTLTAEDIAEYERINSNILNRLAKVSIKFFRGPDVWFRDEEIGKWEIRNEIESYTISSMVPQHTYAVTRDNVFHANRPFCKACDEEFEVGDRVVIIHYPTTSTGERARLGSRIRKRWNHAECFDLIEGSTNWKASMRMDISQRFGKGYRTNDPRLAPTTVKIGHVKGARNLLKLVIPEKGDISEWPTDEDLFQAISEFFHEDKKTAIQSEIDAFVNKYRHELYIENSAKAGVMRYRWREKRAWIAKKDKAKYLGFLEFFN